MPAELPPATEGPRPISLPDGHTLTVEPDPSWTRLFHRSSGWTGSDGIYAIPLSGDESPGSGRRTDTIFVFGDTFIGDVDEDGARVSPVMVNNTLAVLDGPEPDPARLFFLWQTNADGRPASMFVPRTECGRAVPDAYHWLQDGAVVADTLHLFPLIVGPDPTGAEGFQFALHGVTRVSVPIRAGTLAWQAERQTDTPLFYRTRTGRRVYFGAALFPNTLQAGARDPDGHVYIYGLMQASGPPQLVAARAPEAAFEDFAAWRFWDGATWAADRQAVAPIAPAVSHETSVSPLVGGWWQGRYALTCLLGGDTVSLYIGDSPIGPFRDPIPLYRCPERDRSAGVYVYNAKAHPHLAVPGELLISYNVNTTRWDVHLKRADVYRPRFVRVRAAT